MTLKNKELDSKYMPDNTLCYRSKDVKEAVINFNEFLDNLDIGDLHEKGLYDNLYNTVDVIIEEFDKEFGKFEKDKKELEK